MPDIRFGNIDFSGDGAYVWGEGQYSAPTRSVDFIEVPGRNGDLLIDNGNYTNTKAVYRVIITKNVMENVDRLKYLLYSQKGYQKLYDSDLKGFYRMACFCGGFDLSSVQGGVVYIEFDCKPYKYDINGEIPLVFDVEEYNGRISVYNPYFETAHPLIKLYGTSGSIYWGGRGETQISDRGEGHIIIDTDALDAYSFEEQGNESSQKVNRNKDTSDLDLYLPAGYTYIDVISGWHTIEIIPRWVTI